MLLARLCLPELGVVQIDSRSAEHGLECAPLVLNPLEVFPVVGLKLQKGAVSDSEHGVFRFWRESKQARPVLSLNILQRNHNEMDNKGMDSIPPGRVITSVIQGDFSHAYSLPVWADAIVLPPHQHPCGGADSSGVDHS